MIKHARKLVDQWISTGEMPPMCTLVSGVKGAMFICDLQRWQVWLPKKGPAIYKEFYVTKNETMLVQKQCKLYPWYIRIFM